MHQVGARFPTGIANVRFPKNNSLLRVKRDQIHRGLVGGTTYSTAPRTSQRPIRACASHMSSHLATQNIRSPRTTTYSVGGGTFTSVKLETSSGKLKRKRQTRRGEDVSKKATYSAARAKAVPTERVCMAKTCTGGSPSAFGIARKRNETWS